MSLRIFVTTLLIFAGVSSSVFAQITINEISPKNATPGSSITVYGDGFPNSTYAILKFIPAGGGTGVEATITSSELYTIKATVPSGLSAGNYTLEVSRDFTGDTLKAYSPTPFTVIDQGGYFGENGSQVENLLSGGGYSNFEVIDFNSNGHPDFIYTDYSGGKVYWAENDGNTSLSFTEHEIASFTRPQFVKVADIDQDGDMDVVVTQNNTLYYPTVEYKLFWYENDGAATPSFTQHQIADFSGSSLNRITDMSLLDFDQDGFMDVVVSTFDDKEIALFRNYSGSASHFNAKSVIESFSTNHVRRLRVGDIDGDDQEEIVYATLTEVGWINNNSGAYTTTVINDNEVYNSYSLHLSDIDNDGDLDIFTDSNTDKIYMLENDGGGFMPSFTLSTIADNVDVVKILSGDMDADGDTDLLIKNGNVNITMLENNGNSSAAFSKVVISDNEYDIRDIQLGSINNDGGLDIIFRTPSSLNYIKNIDRPAVLGSSVLFDGTEDVIEIPDDDGLDLSNDFTVESWIYPRALDENMHRIISKAGAYGMGVSNTTLRFTTYGVQDYDLAYSVKDSTWTHVATVMDASNKVTFYVNGENIGNVTTTNGAANISIDPLYIGNTEDDGESFNGWIDELRIWGDARTEEEIQANLFQNLTGAESGILAYYSFDEEGSSVTDYSANTFDGTFQGDAAFSTETRPYGTIITGDEGWRMMSSSVTGASYGEILDSLWTQGFTGADYTDGSANVLAWDESSQSFSAISSASEVPEVGQGFLVYVFGDDDFDGTADGFPKTMLSNSNQNAGEVSPTLTYTDSGTLADDGWNLIGNPYGATIDWDAASGWTSQNLDASFYVWSDSANGGAGDYLSWNGTTGTLSDGLIAPWQGFWVKANAADPSFTITDEARSSGGIFLKEKQTSELRLTISDGRFSNSTIVMLDEQAALQKDNLDAYKLQSLNADYLSLFTQTKDGTVLDINALPVELDESLSIPMDIDRGGTLSAQTEFELSWNTKALPEGWTFTLLDNATGEEVNITEQSSTIIELGQAQSSKVSKTLEDSGREDLSTPHHRVLSPKVMKAENSLTPRFTLIITSAQTVANERLADIPNQVELQQNYPNPFNPTTNIEYGVPETGIVTMEVFDLLGRKVATLINRQTQQAGRYSIQFDAGNLASGLYLYRLKAGNTVITKKLTLIK